MSKKSIKSEFIDGRYYEYFRIALAAVMKDSHNPIKGSVLCRGVGISAASLTGFLHPVVSRRLYPSFTVQIAIAKYLGFDYLEFMALGKSKIEPQAHPDKDSLKNQRLLAKAKTIIQSQRPEARSFIDMLEIIYAAIRAPLERERERERESASGPATAQKAHKKTNVIPYNINLALKRSFTNGYYPT